MPRGLPDYYNPDTLVSQRLANVEEVVTSIRRVASLDNRGRTLFVDVFDEGVTGWQLDQDGDGADPQASTLFSISAPASMVLNAGTLGGSGISQAHLFVHAPASDRIGVEFALLYDGQGEKLTILVEYDSGTIYYDGSLVINQSDKTIKVDNDGTLTLVDTLPTHVSPSTWLPVKLVIDFSVGTYLRLIIGNFQYDLSAYNLTDQATTTSGRLGVTFKAEGLAGGAATVFVDHVTITVDEP